MLKRAWRKGNGEQGSVPLPMLDWKDSAQWEACRCCMESGQGCCRRTPRPCFCTQLFTTTCAHPT